jgi:thymidine kinase
MNQLGKLKLIIGPMFSGKSTELIHTVKRYKYKNKKTILVKFDMDNRYSSEDKVVTHDL